MACQNKDCTYDINKESQNFLYNESLKSFYHAIRLLHKKNLLESWKILKNNLYIYPFINEYLELGFYFSIIFKSFS